MKENFLLRWRNLDAALALGSADQPFDELYAAYSETQRAYHTLEHLGECLLLLDSCREAIGEPPAALIELALWFHDGIYDVQSSRNEEKSAEWARRCMDSWNRSTEEKQLVESLILATRHLAAPTARDEIWMIDIDLGILGASTARYQAYEKQVRQEYLSVPWPLYRQKRSEILQAFLDREQIYGTPILRQRLEKSARVNLAWSLDHLRSG